MPATTFASVIIHKTCLMQQIQDYCRVGYSNYVTGVVSAKAAVSWARKADRYYGCLLDRSRRVRAKRAGEACTVLLMHELEGSGELWWILLCTAGDNPAYKLERMKCAFEKTTRIELTGYELCHVTKAGLPRPVITWRQTAAAYSARRAEIIDTVRRGGPLEIRRLIVSLWRAPGFFGIRQQVGHCVKLLRAGFRRRRPSQAMPRIPTKLYYLSRLAVVSVPLSVWVADQVVRVRVATPEYRASVAAPFLSESRSDQQNTAGE